jgi:predicted regulator of amino acid metabolism with ACT domain
MFDCTLVQLKYNQKLIKNTIKTKDVVLENDLIRLFTNAKKMLDKIKFVSHTLGWEHLKINLTSQKNT